MHVPFWSHATDCGIFISRLLGLPRILYAPTAMHPYYAELLMMPPGVLTDNMLSCRTCTLVLNLIIQFMRPLMWNWKLTC